VREVRDIGKGEPEIGRAGLERFDIPDGARTLAHLKGDGRDVPLERTCQRLPERMEARTGGAAGQADGGGGLVGARLRTAAGDDEQSREGSRDLPLADSSPHVCTLLLTRKGHSRWRPPVLPFLAIRPDPPPGNTTRRQLATTTRQGCMVACAPKLLAQRASADRCLSHRGAMRVRLLVAAAGAAVAFSLVHGVQETGALQEPVLTIETPKPAPAWAIAQRELLRVNAEGVQLYAARFLDERGHMPIDPQWGVSDGPDDITEN